MTTPRKLFDEISTDCIAVRMRMLNRAITNLYDDAMRPLGLRVSQVNVLVAAGKMGVARPIELCEKLNLNVSTLSRNVERMKAKGWLETVDDEDGRAQPFRLTKAGEELLRQALPKWRSAQKKATEILGKEGIQQIRKAIQRIEIFEN